MQSSQNLDSMKRKDLKDHLPEPREKFSIKLDEVLKVKRIIHSRVKYVSKNDFDEKVVSLKELQEKEAERMEIKLRTLNKLAIKNIMFKNFLIVFNEIYKEMFAEEFNFKKKRIYFRYDSYAGSNVPVIVESDISRLKSIFRLFSKQTEDVSIMKNALVVLIDEWSEWDRATPDNLVGFLEKSSKDTSKIKMMIFRFKNGKVSNLNGAKVVLSERKRVENSANQRKLFAS